MNCENYLNLIDDLIEGELDKQKMERVNSHLIACLHCSAYYKMAEQEKEIYDGYLTTVEPSPDLWTKLQAKINAEHQVISRTPEIIPARGWKAGISGWFRLYPALGMAAALIVFGGALLRLAPHKNNPGILAEKKSGHTPAVSETKENKSPDSAIKNESSEISASANAVKVNYKNESLNRKTDNPATNKLAALRSLKANKQIITGDKRPPVEIQPNEKQLQLSALENAAARQIEKTELLLRSFRNARPVEDGSVYDVGYEKQQARKLLEKNVQLRQIAENFGDLYTQEILDKVEPLLLDIANLENNPLPEKVLDIKARVKNQNIIASLQTY